MRISDWSSDVCSSDLAHNEIRPYPPFPKKGIAADLASFVCPFRIAQKIGDLAFRNPATNGFGQHRPATFQRSAERVQHPCRAMRHTRHDEDIAQPDSSSDEHTSELQSLMRISFAVFRLQKNTHQTKCYSQIKK